MARTVIVVAAIIRGKSRILISQRKNDSTVEPGRWEFPGGKIDFGEHPVDAIKREIREELGIEITVGRLESAESHVYRSDGADLHVILLFYNATYQAGEVRNLDVQDSKWVKSTELGNFEFVAGDRAVVAKLSNPFLNRQKRTRAIKSPINQHL